MKARILPPTPTNLRRLAAVLRRGGLVAIPTETVYGLDAAALDAKACRAIFRAKGRPANDPLIVHVLDLAQAEQLADLVDRSNVVFALTHNYTGYPLVRQARELILNGDLGEIQAVRAFYLQGWLRSRLETDDQKQAAWRTDPARSSPL